MKPSDPIGPTPTGANTRRGDNAGAIVRAARLKAGLTLADLGQRCGYSPSQISRYERGVQPLTDITLLRRFAAALQIPPGVFGLTPGDGEWMGRHADHKERPTPVPGPIVGPNFRREDGDDPVRRRELLAGAAGLASAAALGLASGGRANSPLRPPTGLADMLYGSAAAAPVTVAALRAAVAQARADFQSARYDRLAARLPGLIATATTTRDWADGDDRAVASSLLADAYVTAANLMVKVNDDPLALALADRAAGCRDRR